MKIKEIRKLNNNSYEYVYDLCDIPFHNFLISPNGTAFVISHNCGIMDEVDFVKGTDIRYQQSKVMNLYTNIKRRMESRYARPNGTLPAMLFLISSKKSEQDFIESYIADLKANKDEIKGVKIVDEPIWNVKPQNYSGRTFPVAVGNKHLKSKFINPSDNIDALASQGYEILNVPIEHRQAFILDLDRALMDIAGISTTLSSKFIALEKLVRCYSDRQNPFDSDILIIGLSDDLTIQQFFHPEVIPQDLMKLPLYIHIDTSLSGDRTGIGGVVISGIKGMSTQNYDLSYTDSLELEYEQLFGVAIQAPSNDEISFEKTRNFIYYLHDVLHLNIQGISSDSFQSSDLHQILTTAGYSTRKLSLDKTPTGYIALRSAINERRIKLLNIKLQEDELINLERNNQTGKIDHPINGCIPGNIKIQTNQGFYDIPTLMKFEKYSFIVPQPKVRVYDTKSKEIKFSEFKNARQTRVVDELYTIRTDTGAEIVCTGNHLVLTDLGYRSANELTKSYNIIRYRMDSSEVVEEFIADISIKKLSSPVEVYDIEVPHYHNFVLQNGLVIHNSKDLCLSEDTDLTLLSGNEFTIGQLYNKFLDDPEYEDWVLSYDTKKGQYIPVRINKVIRKDYVPSQLLRIHLDNNKYFDITEDHLVLLRNGQYKKSQDLEVNDSLMPFNITTKYNYKNYYRCIMDPDSHKYEFIYKLVVHALKNKEYQEVQLKGTPNKYRVIHHVNHNKLDDRPSNLCPMGNADHRKLHGDIFSRYNKSKEKRLRLSKLAKDRKLGFGYIYDQSPEKVAAKCRELGKRNLTEYNKSDKHKEVASRIGKITIYNTLKYAHTPEAIAKGVKTRKLKYHDQYSQRTTRMNKDETIKVNQQVGIINKVYQILIDNHVLSPEISLTQEEFANAVAQAKNSHLINKYYGVPTNNYELLTLSNVPIDNHKIIKIEVINNQNSVYDLVLDKIHNFGISAGIVVHNCDGTAGALWNASESKDDVIESFYAGSDLNLSIDLANEDNERLNILESLSQSIIDEFVDTSKKYTPERIESTISNDYNNDIEIEDEDFFWF